MIYWRKICEYNNIVPKLEWRVIWNIIELLAILKVNEILKLKFLTFLDENTHDKEGCPDKSGLHEYW